MHMSTGTYWRAHGKTNKFFCSSKNFFPPDIFAVKLQRG